MSKNNLKILHWAPTYGSKTGTGLATMSWLEASIGEANGSIDFKVITTCESDFKTQGTQDIEVFGSQSKEKRIKFLKKILPGLDVAHFHGGFDFDLTNALRITYREKRKRHATNRPLKVFITPHGAQSWQVFRRNAAKKWLYWNIIDKPVMRKADAYVCNTPSEAEDMKKRLNCSIETFTIPLALSIEINQSKKTTKLTSDSSKTSFMLCTLGRYDINMKGLDILIGAIIRLNAAGTNVRLRCIGYDNQGGTAMLKNYINSHGCSNLVECVGPKWGEDKKAIISECDLFCVPSRYESFGLSLLDGLIEGLPVLIGNGVCLSSLLSDDLKNNISVAPNIDSWIAAIQSVLTDPHSSVLKSQKVLEQLATICKPEIVGNQLVKIYKGI